MPCYIYITKFSAPDMCPLRSSVPHYINITMCSALLYLRYVQKLSALYYSLSVHVLTKILKNSVPYKIYHIKSPCRVLLRIFAILQEPSSWVVSGTNTGVPPARRIWPRYKSKNGSINSTSSPGPRSVCRERKSACKTFAKVKNQFPSTFPF